MSEPKPMPVVKSFFDEDTNTFSHVVSDPETLCCAVIDSVLNYDAAGAKTSTHSADQIIDYIQHNHLIVEWILETHVHADHLSAAQYLKQKLNGKLAIGQRVQQVQATFADIFNMDIKGLNCHQLFDHLFVDNEQFKIGHLTAIAMYTPGHTIDGLTYLIGDAAFIGDTLFMPDYGTARCDFPNGSAAMLFHSVQQLYALPAETRLFLCHDYKPETRDSFCEYATVAQQKSKNIQLNQKTTESEFVHFRNGRDKTLTPPKLIFPSVQINMCAGQLPVAESNGVQYLKIPLNISLKQK